VFCYKLAPGVRTFSLERVEADVEGIIKDLKPRILDLGDEDFIYDKQRAIAIGEILHRHKSPYCVETRVDNVDREVLQRLKDTGCMQIAFGIESFNQGILDKCRKNIVLDQTYSTIGYAHDAGLKIKGFIMIGLPGETRKTLEETAKAVEKTGIFPRVRLLIPVPGTKIYQDAVRRGMIDEVELLKQYSEHFDSDEGDWVPINLTELSDQELLKARDRIRVIRTY
jgi:radical SAM superfamily enzyme YgiQ (UPF0313 family)